MIDVAAEVAVADVAMGLTGVVAAGVDVMWRRGREMWRRGREML